VAENLTTDKILGPALAGIHRYNGPHPTADSRHCEWIGGEILCGSSKTELRNLTSLRIVLLNALLFRYRGQSPANIENTCRESSFLAKLSKGHRLREFAIKKETTRLRKHFDDALHELGIPYTGRHFLPVPAHGAGKYCRAGNRRLLHFPDP